MKQSRGNRGFSITINNPSPEERQLIHDIILETCDVGIAEMEHTHAEINDKGEEVTPHIQAYLHFPKQKRIDYLKKRFPRSHIEIAKADWRMNFIYCSKENQVFAIKGHTVEEARRKKDKSRLVEIIADAKIMTPQQFEENHPEAWFNWRDKILRVMAEERRKQMCHWTGDLKSKNFWIWGPPRIGKTRWANTRLPIENTYKKPFNKWWDGYTIDDTKIVIIEDYPCLPQGNVLSQHMKIWGDGGWFLGECKGSTTTIEPGRFFFVITSNYPIEQCFVSPEDIQAIKDRFTEIHMTEENKIMINNLQLDESILKQ